MIISETELMTYRGRGINHLKFTNLREVMDGSDVKNRDVEIPVGCVVKHCGKCIDFNRSSFVLE